MIGNFSIREIIEAFREWGIWSSFPGDSRMIREESHVCSFFAFLLHKNFVFSVHTRGIQLVLELLLLASDTLYTQCRDNEHLHEEI